MDQLRYKFLDTSCLKKTPAQMPQQKLKPLPAFHPINPENFAREALIVAFHARESTRVELSRNYSDACVERFSQKAQAYKAKRKALASLMPSGNLSPEDEASFPHLSTKDTDPPVVCIDGLLVVGT
jgi:predicted methyltransferase